MTNYDRGYDPPPDEGVFDAADDGDEEEGSRLPLLIVIALVVLAAFAGVVWLAYSQGVQRGRSDAGGAVAQQETAAPSTLGSQDTVKPYEQPAPAEEEADNAPSEPAATTDEETPPAVMPAPTPAPARTTAPPAQQTASVTPQPAAAKPAAPASADVASAKPAAAPAPANPAPVAASAPAPGAEVAAGPGFALQIGAYKSQADADSAWAAYKAKHAAIVGSYSSSTVKADLGAKGTWYRLRIGPIPSRADATALCEKLKADGGSCFLAK